MADVEAGPLMSTSGTLPRVGLLFGYDWDADGFAALETMAADCAPYLSGKVPGLADICLVPQMYNARRFDVGLAPFPRLVAIDAALTALPPFVAAHPDAVRP